MATKTKLRLIKIFVIALSLAVTYQLVSPAFLSDSNVYAVGDLTVNWGVGEGNPIFVVNNWMPGQFETRTVGVTNNATIVRPVGVRGIKTTETGNISQVIDFTISQGATDLYGGTSPTGPRTLAQFFIDSAGPDGIFLSALNPGASTNYTFKATFQSSAGNGYQGKSVTFNIKIGISISIPAECLGINFQNTIFGTQNNDVLNGGNTNDLIFGLEGNDIINSGNGKDCIVGGDGNDMIYAGNEKDVIVDMGGNNYLDGGNDRDKIVAGPGNDNIKGNNENDTINAGNGNNTIDGGNGNDIIVSGSGNDNIKGGNNNDKVNAGGGNDTIYGENGNDNLDGEAGTDKTDGGLSTDTCIAETRINCEL